MGMSQESPTLSPKKALKSAKFRKFTGRAEDFEEWEGEWNQFLKLMHGGQGVLPDATVLLTLKGYLDPASAADLQGRLNMDDNLSYYEFMELLRARYLRDGRMTHRRKWSLVKLHHNGQMPTLQEWSRFEAQYLAKRAMVEDWTDAVDHKLVFQQIPADLQKKVVRETLNRRWGKYWARLSVPKGYSPLDVKTQMEGAVGAAFPQYEMERRHIVVQLQSEAQLIHLLRFDKARLDGRTIRIHRA